MRLRLREARERKFLTQEELSKRTGISVGTIHNLENGRTKPRLPTVRKLAEGLGVSPEDLIADWGTDAGDEGKAAA